MKIIFEKVELHNFMSFADESFDFSLCKGMNLIRGKNNDVLGSSNGSGKSTLYASIAYALFGQMQSEMKNKNIVSRTSSKKDMDVVLFLSIDDKKYKIRRGLAKGNNSYLSLFEINDDGTENDVTKSTIAETQKHIEDNLIKLDLMMFFRTILLTSDQNYNFYKMKKADKKEFVEKLFDISIFEEMHKALHKDYLSLSKDMDTCQARLMVLSKNNEDYEEKIKSYESIKSQKIDNANKELNAIIKDLDDAKNAKSKIDTTLSSKIENAISKLMSSYEESLSKQADLKTKSNMLDLEIHKLKESCKANNAIISKHKDVLPKLCNECKNVFIKHYNLDEYARNIKDATAKIATLDKNKINIADEIKNIANIVDLTKSKISIAKEKLQDIRSKIDEASRKVMLLESQVASKNNVLTQLKNETNPYDSLISKCKSNIENETKNISKIESSIRYLRFAENIVAQETIRKFIIRDLVVLLNNKVKTYLTKLGANFYVEFDENMDYEFITPTGTCEWGNFSAGERTRIMIATSFAFRDFMSIRNGLQSNILILDEYFDSAIDSMCIESILSLLKEFSDVQKQDIYVITHRQEVSADMFDRTILVEKTNNIAHAKII